LKDVTLCFLVIPPSLKGASKSPSHRTGKRCNLYINQKIASPCFLPQSSRVIVIAEQKLKDTALAHGAI